MALAAALCALLAFVSAEALAQDFQLEVVILHGWLEVKEAKWSQKVSTLLLQSKEYYLMANSDA